MSHRRSWRGVAVVAALALAATAGARSDEGLRQVAALVKASGITVPGVAGARLQLSRTMDVYSSLMADDATDRKSPRTIRSPWSTEVVIASPEWPDRIEVVDSHTEGEPTRVVIEGWPVLEGATMDARRDDLLRRHDRLRQAVVCEPRGHDAVVGALLTPPVDTGSATGVVFFNNAGALGMCGHGLIGVMRTLEHLGRLGVGPARIDTPVGTVGAELHEDGSVTIQNVPAVCHALDVDVEVAGPGVVRGDVAWGGNWFFLAALSEPALEPANLAALTEVSTRILQALREQGVTGSGGAEIDHVELFGPPGRDDADARNFVLCPGLAWDRSPCGTGTSAKMAALAARGKLGPGQRWRQESLTGGLFEGWLEDRDGDLVPHVRGRAFVTSRATLLFDPRDPLRSGFNAAR